MQLLTYSKILAYVGANLGIVPMAHIFHVSVPAYCKAHDFSYVGANLGKNHAFSYVGSNVF